MSFQRGDTRGWVDFKAKLFQSLGAMNENYGNCDIFKKKLQFMSCLSLSISKGSSHEPSK